MKIDIEIVKNYLTVFQEYNSPVISTYELFKQLELDFQKKDDIKTLYFYLKILFDQDLIDIESSKAEDKQTLGFSFSHSGNVILLSRYFRLTNEGHKTLEIMQQSKIWNLLKPNLAQLV
jgi:hypothetical protein